MIQRSYDRSQAVAYAKEWAFKRNPTYLNFDQLGGDCTNYASQCIYAGSKIMNPKKIFGWYYYSSRDRTPSWTGVQYLYDFLVHNEGVGPYAVVVGAERVEPGDIVQLGTEDGHFYHSPVVVAKDDKEIYVAAHTFDAYFRPLSAYVFSQARFLHIAGVRSW